MSSIMESITTIALAIVGLAIVAVIVSKKANTSGVLQSAASGFSNAIGVASAPVSGANVSLSLGYPSGNDFGSSFGN